MVTVTKLVLLALTGLMACGAGDPRDAMLGSNVPPRVAAEVVSVVDGDTFHAKALVWPDVNVAVSVRLRGVDTPELRGRCQREKARARRARDFVRQLLPAGARVQLSEVGRDKYAGRVDARVTLADGRDLAKLLIERGLGRPMSLLLFTGLVSFDAIPLDEIEGAEIVTSENQASLAGKLGWGTAGAVVLGPIGLLAGLLAGGNRQSVILAVKFKDGRGVLLEGKSRDMQPLLGAGYGG